MKEYFQNNEILHSFHSVAKDRAGSVLYGTFVIAWFLWNWQAVYITLFVDQDIIFELTQQLKIDYILIQYQWGLWSPFLWSLLRVVIGPFLSAWFVVWWLAFLDLEFFKKNYSYKVRKEEEVLKKKQHLLKVEQRALQQKQENVEIQKEIVKDLSDEQKWDLEYDELKGDHVFKSAMRELRSSVYSHGGWIRGNVSTNNLSYLHVNEFILFGKDDNSRLETTEKGRYFLKRVLQDGLI